MHSGIALIVFTGGAVVAGWVLRDTLHHHVPRIRLALVGKFNASTLFQENRR